MRDGFPWVFGIPGQTEGLWSVEGNCGSDLSFGRWVSSHESGLFSILGLGLLGSGGLGWKESQHGSGSQQKKSYR